MSHSNRMLDVRMKRGYLPAFTRDGTRILVDRIWPRGLRKSAAAIAHWVREIAPSTGLRHRFGHDPARWEEFPRRYRAELKGKAVLLDRLRGIARRNPLTLAYSAGDEQHNQAVVLKDVLLH